MAKRPAIRPIANTQILTIETIRNLYRRRTTWHKSEKTLTLQGKAACRRICDGDKVAGSALFDLAAKLADSQIAEVLANGHENTNLVQAVEETYPIIKARVLMEKNRRDVESQYETLVWDLPIMEWADKIHGIGPGSIAALIGSTGNLWHYPTVQKFWNRMGLAVMPDGRRQRNIVGRAAADATMGHYNAQRRSIVWNIGTSIMFAQTGRINKETGEIKSEAGEYRKIYDSRRAYEEEKNNRGDYAPLAALILRTSNLGKTTEAYKAYKEGRLPKAHLKSRCQRYMEKEFLKRFWVEWRQCMHSAKPSDEDREALDRMLLAKKAERAAAKPEKTKGRSEETIETET